MANPHKGELAFEAGGKTYTLRFSTNAICELEDKLDRSFLSISGDLAKAVTEPDKVRFGTVRAIMWAGLRDHHPNLTVEEAGEIMTQVGGMLPAVGLVTDAFVLAFPSPEAKDSNPPRPDQKIGTGPAS